MPNINIAVRNKIAKNVDETEYICGNSDFLIDFDFDAEWDAYETKTARFIYGTAYQDIVFQGAQCKVPVMSNTNTVLCGVFAGDLKTTTPALIKAQKSILCGSGSPAAPAEDVYAQIMELIQGMNDPEAIAMAVAEYMAQNPFTESDPTVPEWAKAEQKPEYTADEVGAVGKDELPEAINTALAQAKESGEFEGAPGKDGEDGKDGYTPIKGVDYFDGVDGKNGQDGYTPVKGKDYFDGKNGEDGKDATSPVISVSNITGGHRITIKDVNGTKTVDVMDGSDGSDGKDGNGIKSAVLNADYTLTLTFDNGTKYTTPSIRGASGADGKDGSNGQDGKTPVKGVDYFDGNDGKDGNDGVSATHSWNGTTLTVTSASGTSSADLKGEKGNDGYTPVKGKDYFDGSDGKDGQNGQDGHTPVKGTDYWTDADKAAMVNDVLAALPTWTGGSY